MIKVGFGYDVHRLTKGRKLVIGGVNVPFETGLLGHSDADVLCHAIADALLGATGKGDIGHYFPASNEKYRDISSLIILEEIHKMLAESNFKIINLDTTIVAEKPKIYPFISQMKANIAKMLKIEPEQVSVKETTSEGLGFIGVGDGIAAYAVVLIEGR